MPSLPIDPHLLLSLQFFFSSIFLRKIKALSKDAGEHENTASKSHLH
jgi:hypothetical protein